MPQSLIFCLDFFETITGTTFKHIDHDVEFDDLVVSIDNIQGFMLSGKVTIGSFVAAAATIQISSHGIVISGLVTSSGIEIAPNLELESLSIYVFYHTYAGNN